MNHKFWHRHKFRLCGTLEDLRLKDNSSVSLLMLKCDCGIYGYVRDHNYDLAVKGSSPIVKKMLTEVKADRWTQPDGRTD